MKRCPRCQSTCWWIPFKFDPPSCVSCNAPYDAKIYDVGVILGSEFVSGSTIENEIETLNLNVHIREVGARLPGYVRVWSCGTTLPLHIRAPGARQDDVSIPNEICVAHVADRPSRREPRAYDMVLCDKDSVIANQKSRQEKAAASKKPKKTKKKI